MASVFAQIGAARSPASIIDLARDGDCHVASHALHTLARVLTTPGDADSSALDQSGIANLMHALQQPARRCLDSREISKAAWGLARLYSYVKERSQVIASLGSLAARAVTASEQLDARAATALLHAYGTIGSAPSIGASRMLQRRVAALAVSAQCSPQDLANSLWALAKLGCSVEPTLVDAMGTALHHAMPNFKPMELSCTAWAMAKLQLGLEPTGLVQALHEALHGDGSDGKGGGKGSGKQVGRQGSQALQGLSAQGAANCLWALARLEPAPPAPLVTALLAQSARQASALTPQGLANVCSAAARLGAPADVPLRLLANVRVVEALGASDVAEVAWALGRLHLASPPPHKDLSAGQANGSQLEGLLAALWRQATVVAPTLGWQEAGLLEFALRTFYPSLCASRASAPRRPVEREGGSAAQTLLALLDETTERSMSKVKGERATLDSVAVRCLLDARPAPWAELTRRAEPVLLVGVGSAGDACDQLTAAIGAAGHLVSHWHRFADEKLPAGYPAACAWPPDAPGGDGYAAAIVRLPPSRSSLQYVLHATASVLRPGGLLLVFGCREEGIHATRAHVPTLLYERVAPVCGDGDAEAASVLRAYRSAAAADAGGGVSKWEEVTTLELPASAPPASQLSTGGRGAGAAIASSGTPPPPAGLLLSRQWITMPGLFARGGLDIMTSALLAALPAPAARARVLDFCSGSGVIGAALQAREPSVRLHLLDADALAIHAAGRNVPSAHVLLTDGWAGLPPKPRFDWIVSNPPVHLGLQTDFRVVRKLIAGAAKHLKAGGTLWIVAQTYVPIGRLLAQQPCLLAAHASADDGRFTVWRATRAPRDSKCEGAEDKLECESPRPRPSPPEQAAAVVPSGEPSKPFPPIPPTRSGSRAPAPPITQHGRGQGQTLQAAAPATHEAPPRLPMKRTAAPIDWSMSKSQRKRLRRKAQ